VLSMGLSGHAKHRFERRGMCMDDVCVHDIGVHNAGMHGMVVHGTDLQTVVWMFRALVCMVRNVHGAQILTVR
jgi:hypothetical protein